MARGKLTDLTGQRFGRYVVIERVRLEKQRNVHALWKCICDCGTIKNVNSKSLVSGAIVSCGCYMRENSANRLRTHNMSFKRPYKIWSGMIGRCKGHREGEKKNYKDRGIEVCDEWNTSKGGSFEKFWEDMKDGYSDKLSLDRINNDKGYCKENCRWTTRSQQSFNTRRRSYHNSPRRGVNLHPTTGKWNCKIRVNNRNIHLGYFTDLAEAIKVREQAELKYFGETREN